MFLATEQLASCSHRDWPAQEDPNYGTTVASIITVTGAVWARRRCEMEPVDAEEDVGITASCPSFKQEAIIASCLLRLNQLPPRKGPATSSAASPGCTSRSLQVSLCVIWPERTDRLPGGPLGRLSLWEGSGRV